MKKKSVRKTAEWFIAQADGLENFYKDILGAGLTEQQVTWACDGALVKLNAYFEQLMLFGLIGAINNDTTTLTASTGVAFPKHLTDEVCEYIVTRGGYFDFRGREGLIRVLKKFVPETHYLVDVVKAAKYRQTLDRFFALRNLAAHESRTGKTQAKAALATNVNSAGAWVKRHNRFLDISAKLKELATDIRNAAPY